MVKEFDGSALTHCCHVLEMQNIKQQLKYAAQQLDTALRVIEQQQSHIDELKYCLKLTNVWDLYLQSIIKHDTDEFIPNCSKLLTILSSKFGSDTEDINIFCQTLSHEIKDLNETFHMMTLSHKTYENLRNKIDILNAKIHQYERKNKEMTSHNEALIYRVRLCEDRLSQYDPVKSENKRVVYSNQRYYSKTSNNLKSNHLYDGLDISSSVLVDSDDDSDDDDDSINFLDLLTPIPSPLPKNNNNNNNNIQNNNNDEINRNIYTTTTTNNDNNNINKQSKSRMTSNIIHTVSPDEPIIKFNIENDYNRACNEDIKDRRKALNNI